MKKRSLFVGAGVLLFLLIAVYVVLQKRNGTLDYYADYTLFRERQILLYSKLVKNMVDNNQIEDIEPALKDAIENYQFDWYALSYQGKTISSWPPGSEMLSPEKLKSEEVNDPEFSYKTTVLKPETKITIGINKRPWEYTLKYSKRFWKADVQDLIIPVVLALAIFFYFLKDILSFIGILSSRGRNRETLAAVKIKSHEGSVLSGALLGFEQSLQLSQEQVKLYSSQMLPSLRRELESGIKPPYDFNCALVRIDVNNYSEIFLQGDRDALIDQLNLFFVRVADCVSRFDGLIYEFIGDEILYYIKREDSAEAAALATSSVREIFKIAQDMDGVYQKKLGYPLRLKAALCTGQLRFGPLVNTHTLSGSILIETVRMLSFATDKKKNSLILLQRDAENLQQLVTLTPLTEAILKGYRHPSRLLQADEFKNLADVAQKAELVHLFRHPTELQQTFVQVLNNTKTFSLPEQKRLLSELSKIYLGQKDISLSQCYLREFEKALRGTMDVELLSHMVSLAEKWWDGNSAEVLQNLLQKALAHPDARVQANALEVAGLLQLKLSVDPRFHTHEVSRVRANALMVQSFHSLEREYLESLKQFLGSLKNEREQESLAYALTKTLQYWMQKDPVYLSAQSEFFELLSQFLNRYVDGRRLKDLQKIFNQIQSLDNSQSPTFSSTKSFKAS